jgi:hypothetical protein
VRILHYRLFLMYQTSTFEIPIGGKSVWHYRKCRGQATQQNASESKIDPKRLDTKEMGCIKFLHLRYPLSSKVYGIIGNVESKQFYKTPEKLQLILEYCDTKEMGCIKLLLLRYPFATKAYVIIRDVESK